MRRSFLIAALTAVPLIASALDYTNQSQQFTDAPFTNAETAGISFLYNLGAVQGNPDGTFQPQRTLNRAEFLKIALLSAPNVRVSTSDAESCFPDVRKSDWFSSYVCLAKKRGIIAGYPDGYFRPENPVNYAEALKILGGLYEYALESQPGDAWYIQYVNAADDQDTLLPINLAYDAYLTRGQMARLAAGFRAESEGELSLYRQAESGQVISTSSSSRSSSSSSSQAASSQSSLSSSSVSSSSSSSVAALFPTEKQYLLLGLRSNVIADATFTANYGETELSNVEVLFNDEIESLESLILVNAQGTELATLTLDFRDTDDETWSATIPTGTLRLTGNQSVTLGLIAITKSPELSGGFAGETVRVMEMRIAGKSVATGTENQLTMSNSHFLEHLTSLGRITSVQNTGGENGALVTGNDQVLGAFAMTAQAVSPATVRLTNVSFDLNKSTNVNVVNLELGFAGSTERVQCYTESSVKINCFNIPSTLGTLSSSAKTAQLYGDVSFTGSGYMLQLSLPVRNGDLGGGVRFHDTILEHNRVETGPATVTGTRWAN